MLDRLEPAATATGSDAASVIPAGGRGQPALIVFDGLCVLCSAQAQFVLRHDRDGRFRLTTGDYETMLVLRDGEILQHSDAALAVAAGLGWPWRAAVAARIVPRRIRDALYRLVARNRYDWFGRRDVCWMATPDHASRIL